MAAVVKYLAPAAWPALHVATMLAAAPADKAAEGKAADKAAAAAAAAPPKAKGYTLSPLAHAQVIFASLPKLVVALWAYAALGNLAQYATLTLPLVLHVVLRDQLVTWATAEGWYWVVTDSPMARKLQPVKYNPAQPKPAQVNFERFWSTVSTLISSALELALLWAWANVAAGTLPAWVPAGVAAWVPRPAWEGWFPGGALWTHAPTVAWLVAMPYVRISHFWAVHRLMHPWRTTTVPDVGKFLYKWVHSLHHKSKNPTPWSGVASELRARRSHRGRVPCVCLLPPPSPPPPPVVVWGTMPAQYLILLTLPHSTPAPPNPSRHHAQCTRSSRPCTTLRRSSPCSAARTPSCFFCSSST